MVIGCESESGSMGEESWSVRARGAEKGVGVWERAEYERRELELGCESEVRESGSVEVMIRLLL